MHSTADLPIDKGWAWMVALGSCLSFFITGIIMCSLGIMYAEIVEQYNVSAVKASWIPSLLIFFTFFCAPIAGCFCKRFSCRAGMAIGTTLTVAGCVLCVADNSIEMLYISYGVLLGIGCSFTFTSSVTVIPIFFEKRCSLANGISGLGAGIGAIIGPILVRYLLDECGLKGCFLILGGICLNMFVCAGLYRDIAIYREQKDSDTCHERVEILANGKGCHDTLKEVHGSSLIKSDISLTDLTDTEHDISSKTRQIDDSLPGTTLLNPEKDRDLHQNDNCNSEQSISTLNAIQASSYLGTSVLALSAVGCELNGTANTGDGLLCCCFKNKSDKKSENNRQIFEWKLLKNPVFVLIMIVTGFFTFFGPLLTIIIPSHAMQYGISKSQVAMMLSLAVLPDPLFRLFIGWFADLHIIPSIYMFAIFFGLLSAITFALPFLTIFPLLFGYTLLRSCFSGAMYCLLPTVLVHVLGGESISSSFTLCLLAEGFLNLAGPPVIGFLYDMTNSWTLAIFVCATGTSIAAVLVVIAACIDKRRSRRTQKRNDTPRDIPQN